MWPWSSKRKTMLGITSRSHENIFRWLVESIRMNFSDVFDVKYLPITNTNRYDWEEGVRECSAVILYHTKIQGRVNITDVDGSLYDEELRYLSQRLGKEKVVVLLDDMEDISENERKRILTDQPSMDRLASHLILIPERNKSGTANRELQELFHYLSKGVRTSSWNEEESFGHKVPSWASEKGRSAKDFFNITAVEIGKHFGTNSTSAKSKQPPHPSYRVGIFSRSAHSNYTWLMDGLKADPRLRSAEINAFSITNNSQTFRSGLQQCHFTILYHTKKQGRINITNVTSSLYDEELQEMSRNVGKGNVIVVVDDLDSVEPEVKHRILAKQPKIGLFARDLFLFTETHKHTMNVEEIRGIIRESLTKFEAQFSVADTQEHPMEVHRNVESSMTDARSSVDSPDNRTAQDKETSSAASPFSSQSDSHQKSNTAEPQSKRSKTTSNEETDSMDDLTEPSPFYLIRVMSKKWENSQQENKQLGQTIKQLKEENAHQKIIIQNQKENHSQEETIKKLKGKYLYQKENIKKTKNEYTAGEGIGWKAEDIKMRGEEIRRNGEEIQRMGEEIQRRGEQIQRRREEIQRRREEIQRRREEIQRRREEIKRRGEEIQRRGEEIQRKGERRYRGGERRLSGRVRGYRGKERRYRNGQRRYRGKERRYRNGQRR